MSDLLGEAERVYREAVAEMPYCSISVKMLCARAGVTRKAFYKTFGCKSDVLRAIFERDVVRPQVELIELLSFDKMRLRAPQMERHMFQAVRDDGAFYRDVVLSPQGGREAFLQAVGDVFRDFNESMLQEYGFKGEAWQRDFAASYFAEAKAYYFLKWIEGDFAERVEDVSALYSRMALPFWKSLA